MALAASKAVVAGSASKGNARLVLLCFADCVNEERLRRGLPAEAWPSQNWIAKWCNCSRSTVEEALAKLVELGEIVDTGKRKSRGTIVWELPLPVLPDSGASEEGEVGQLPDSRHDLPDLPDDLPDSGASPARTSGHEPVVNPKGEPEKNLSSSSDIQQTKNGNSAKEQQQVERSSQIETLAALREQLPTLKGNFRSTTERSIKALEQGLGEAVRV